MPVYVRRNGLLVPERRIARLPASTRRSSAVRSPLLPWRRPTVASRPRMLVLDQLIGLGAGGSAVDPRFYEGIVDLGLSANLTLCLDAGDSASYSSGQKWLDRTAGGYDFFVGADGSATATDPTFNGSAGGLSSAEYWSNDSNDIFRYDTTNETWMQNIHKDNASFAILAWVYPPTAVNGGICGTRGGGGSEVGFAFSFLTEKMNINIVNNSTVLTVTADSAITQNAWRLVGVSLDEATGAGGGFFYDTGSYAQVSSANTFTSTYSSPGTGNASETFEIMSRGGSNLIMGSGFRIAGLMIWTTALTKSQIDSIYNAQKSRFGL